MLEAAGEKPRASEGLRNSYLPTVMGALINPKQKANHLDSSNAFFPPLVPRWPRCQTEGQGTLLGPIISGHGGSEGMVFRKRLRTPRSLQGHVNALRVQEPGVTVRL